MEAALEAIKTLPLNGKLMDATSAARRARRTAAKKARQGEVIAPLPEDAIRIYHCDLKDLQELRVLPLARESDLHEHPYGKDFLPRIGELAAMAGKQ